MKQCPKCGASIADTAKFCPKCGVNIKKHEEENNRNRFCPECGTEVTDCDFCPECGYRLNGAEVCEQKADAFSDDWLVGIENSANNAVAQKQAVDIQRQIEQTFAAYKYEKHTDGTYTITGLKDKTALRYSVPQGVISIADSVFAGCGAVEISLPAGLLQIGDGAFKGCANLSSINLPESLMIVGDDAFAECEMLDITLPPSVRKVGKDAVKNTVQDKKRQAEVAKRKAEEEAKCRAEAEAKRKEEEETQRRAEEETKRKAEEEARRRAEAEAKRKAEKEARRRAEAEAKRKAEEEAKRRAEAEAKRKAEEEARRRVEAEAEAKRKAEFEAKYPVGTIMMFGSYHHQSGRKKEPIEWLVLAIEVGRALLISKYVLDCKKYNEKKENVTWETCTLRKWLNEEFLNTAFSQFEQAKIQSTRIDNPNNTRYGTKGGNATTDKIFVLSIDEAEKHFSSKAARECNPTKYAKHNGASVDSGNCNWFLRSSGNDSNFAAYVLSLGIVNVYGLGVDSTDVGIRPALWIKIQ